MEYQKIIHFLDNTPNQPAKFKAINWVEINDDSRGTYNVNSQIKFKNSMLRSSFIRLKGHVDTFKWNYINYWSRSR